MTHWRGTCVTHLRGRLGLVVLRRVDMLVCSAVGAEIHVFVRVVTTAMTVRYVGGGVVEWTIIARRTGEDRTKYSDAGEDVGRKRRGRISRDTVRLGMVEMVGEMLLRLGVLVVNRGPTAARRLAERKTVARVTSVTSTAARRRFTL